MDTDKNTPNGAATMTEAMRDALETAKLNAKQEAAVDTARGAKLRGIALDDLARNLQDLMDRDVGDEDVIGALVHGVTTGRPGYGGAVATTLAVLSDAAAGLGTEAGG